MLKHRIIPCLLLKNQGLYKTEKFKNPKYIGDPLNAIRIFNEKEIDELILIDIEASRLNKEPDYNIIKEIAGECFMPLCYGGGIKNIDHVSKLFALGIEKVCLNSVTFDNINLIKEISKKFGSQSIVVSIDIVKTLFGIYRLYRSDLRIKVKKQWKEHIREVMEAGAGELLINSVNLDGTRKGTDLNLIKEATSLTNLPTIAMGGVGSLSDIKKSILAGANAIAAGAFFVFHGPHKAVLISYPTYSDLEELFK